MVPMLPPNRVPQPIPGPASINPARITTPQSGLFTNMGYVIKVDVLDLDFTIMVGLT